MNADIIAVALAALFTGLFAGVGLVGAVQYIHDRRTLGTLGRRDGAA